MPFDYVASVRTYRMQINTLHAMIWVCRDASQITRLQARIQEYEQLAREHDYLASHVNDQLPVISD